MKTVRHGDRVLTVSQEDHATILATYVPDDHGDSILKQAYAIKTVCMPVDARLGSGDGWVRRKPVVS